MAPEPSSKHVQSQQLYRALYARLLHLFPTPFHNRFGAEMEQVFKDLCGERLKANKGLFGFILWIYIETLITIIRENLAANPMKTTSILRVLLITAGILSIPAVAMLTSAEGWKWSIFDFLGAGIILSGAGFTFELIASRAGSMAYKAAIGIAVITSVLLIWINGAAGIIGDGPINLLYGGVLLVGIAGAIISQLKPFGMFVTLCAVAVAQMVVPIIALITNQPYEPGVLAVFILNGGFAGLWLLSALLFRKASKGHAPAVQTLA